MLKKSWLNISAAVTALLLSAAASAQTVPSSPFYAGAEVGKGSWNDNCNSTMTCSTNSNTYKLFGGYQIDKNFAVEGSYFSLGSINGSANINGALSPLRLKGTGFEIDGVYNQELTNQLTGFAKLGVASIKTEGSGMISDSTTSTQPVIGVGLKYKLTNELSLRTEFESRKVKFEGDKETVNNLSVGLQYHF